MLCMISFFKQLLTLLNVCRHYLIIISHPLDTIITMVSALWVSVMHNPNPPSPFGPCYSMSGRELRVSTHAFISASDSALHTSG